MRTGKILCVLLAVSFALPAYAKDMDASIKAAWENPKVITNSWERGKGHNSSTGMPDQTFWLNKKLRSANAPDEAIVMVYMARQVVEHGGFFCVTQLRSRNKGGKGCPKIWTQYQNPVGDFDRTCFWLCEPGYAGQFCNSVENAKKRLESGSRLHKKNAEARLNTCAYTKLNSETLLDGIDYQQTGEYDTAAIETVIDEAAARFQYNHQTNKANESDVILVAREYLDSGHGIIAQPVTYTAHGGMWNAENYSDEWLDCANGDSNLTVTANGGGYISKTLCMPGFYGENCTTEVCKECDDPLTAFNDETGYCSNCIENHIHGEDGLCVECPDGTTAVPEKDICLKCKPTEYVRDGECAPRDAVSKERLYECFPNNDIGAFQKCVTDTCTDGDTVSCMIQQNQIGQKKCTDGKWGPCGGV